MTNNIFFFSDLDDTLIQTKRKTNFDKKSIVASYDKLGNPSSYIYEGINLFINTIINSGITFVPTTARNLESYKRTIFYKNKKIKYVILNFGALILVDNHIDNEWSNYITKQYSMIKNLEIVVDQLKQFVSKRELKLRIKIISGYYISLYNEIELDNSDSINNIRVVLNEFLLEYTDYYLYENGNSFGILPTFLNKKYAVEFLTKRYSPILTIGAGDNKSDLDFIKFTTLKLFPDNSLIK